MDNKEYHFCFAYVGERMRTTAFKELHFQQVEGVTFDGNLQMVSVSLCRRNGRREANIPRVLDEYNKLSEMPPIVPVIVPGNKEAIICFRSNQGASNNVILYRIDWEKATNRYWRWDTPAQSRKNQAFLTGLEGLVRELNLNPNTLCMDSAYDAIAKVYLEVKGVELKNPAALPAEDRDFLMQELKRFFDRERMFVVAPPTREDPGERAKAIVHPEAIMTDMQFKDEPNPPPPEPVNATVRTYFKDRLQAWADKSEVCVLVKDVLAVFNKSSPGLYRHATVVAFFRPLISVGAVELRGDAVVCIRPALVAEFLKK